MSFADLESTTTAPCNNSGANQLCARQFKKLENAAGEIVRATDANGFNVNYERDADGNLITVGRVVNGLPLANSAFYDARGRKRSQSDTDGGSHSFKYNAAGELIQRTDARGQVVRMDVDARGRVWRVRASSSPNNACGDCLYKDGFENPGSQSGSLIVDITEYDTATNGRGLVAQTSRTEAGAPTISYTYTYDTLARPVTRHALIDAKTYVEQTVYDSLGRVLKTLVQYTESYNNPGGAFAYSEGYEQAWNARGFLERVCKAVDASNIPSGCPSGITGAPVYWRIYSQDARGQVVLDERHNSVALQSTRTYEPSTGRLATLRSGTSNSLQNLSYNYDLAGNLIRRQDFRGTLKTEDFRYDALDRIVESRLNNQVILSLTYDVLGNICSKNSNSYVYAGRAGCPGALNNASKSAHAVTQAFGNAYSYDENGLQTRTDGPGTAGDRYTEYDAHHRMTGVVAGSLTASSFQAEYRYGPDLSLVAQIERNSALQVIRRTHYIGGLEWTDRNPGGTANREARLSLPGGLVLIKAYTEGQLPVTRYRYLFTDVLGSVDVIADENGTAVERMSFDVHGRRRSEADWLSAVVYGADATTRRGYTGHEQIDGAGLIHMRARMYDPQLGRFLQPDPMIEPDATQGWNRYSYVLNNPMTATDPTGMLSRREAIAGIRTVAAIAITVYSGQMLFSSMCLSPAAAAAAASSAVFGGFTAGLVAGGLQGGVSGAFGGALYFGIGNYFQAAGPGLSAGAYYTQKTLAHAVAGGVLSRLEGGQFGHGFVSAGFTQLVAPGIEQIGSRAGSVFMAAIVGGAAAELSGGKFANGAMTSAFSWAFNSLAHQSPLIALSKSNPKNGYANLEDAALAQFNEHEAAYQATSSGEELFGYIATRNIKGKVRFFYSEMIIVDATFRFSFNPVGPRNMSIVSFSHTHPPATGENQELFSGGDMRVVGWKGAPGRPYILRTPQGRVQYINPSSSKGFRATAGTSLCPNGAICLPAHQKEPR